MRKERNSTVDLHGCHLHSNKNDSEIKKKFQHFTSLLLSAQSRDELTHKVMMNLNKEGLSIELIENLSQSQVKERIRSINYNETKAKNLKKCFLS